MWPAAAAPQAADELSWFWCCWYGEVPEAVEGVVERQLDVFEGLGCGFADLCDLFVEACGGDAAGDPANTAAAAQVWRYRTRGRNTTATKDRQYITCHQGVGGGGSTAGDVQYRLKGPS